MENSTAFVRLGGHCGIRFVILLVPGVVAARPDVPDASLSAPQMLDYVDGKQGALLVGNGLSFYLRHFLLSMVLRRTAQCVAECEGEESGLSSSALTGSLKC